MCLHHFLRSLSGCNIMCLRGVFPKWSTLQYSNLCSLPLDGPPWGPGHVHPPHSCCCLPARSWSYSVVWSPFFLPGERAGSSSHFPTSLPKCKEHLLFIITQLDYMWLKPHYWPSNWKRRWRLILKGLHVVLLGVSLCVTSGRERSANLYQTGVYHFCRLRSFGGHTEIQHFQADQPRCLHPMCHGPVHS